MRRAIDELSGRERHGSGTRRDRLADCRVGFGAGGCRARPELFRGSGLAWRRCWSFWIRMRDGTLSAEEIAEREDSVAARRHGCERRGGGERNPPAQRAASRACPCEMGHSLVVPLDANTDWDSLAATLASVYARQRAHRADSTTPIKERIRAATRRSRQTIAELLMSRPMFRCAWISEASRRDKRRVRRCREPGAARRKRSRDGNGRCHQPGSRRRLSGDFGRPVRPANRARRRSESQIGVGAVIDGNPLLRLVDQDQDQRLTLRERQELSGLLTSLDRDARRQAGRGRNADADSPGGDLGTARA